jgi:hypothetical protein
MESVRCMTVMTVVRLLANERLTFNIYADCYRLIDVRSLFNVHTLVNGIIDETGQNNYTRIRRRVEFLLVVEESRNDFEIFKPKTLLYVV